MRQLAFLLTTIVATVTIADDRPTVQIAMIPYYQSPAIASRLTINPDGTVVREQSAIPVNVVNVEEMGGITWVPDPKRPTDRISVNKHRSLWSQLQGLGLEALANEYSAEFAYDVPGQVAQVRTESGGTYTVPAQTERIVTHSATYQLRIHSAELSVESAIYAPLAALEWEDPPHPDRQQILKFVSAWYFILRTSGPMADSNAKCFRPYIP